MKTILIPTDFSENAGNALAYALELMADTPAHIHIISVLEPPQMPSEVPISVVDLTKQRMEESQNSMALLEAFGNEYGSNIPDNEIKISTEVIVGSPIMSIKDEAKEKNVDMIIMGTQGDNHSYLDKVIGTVSLGVVDGANCPVILIPRDFEFKTIDSLLFATTLDHKDPYELWRALQLIKPHSGIVRCLHVYDNMDSIDMKDVDTFTEYLSEHEPAIQNTFHLEKSDDVEKAISNYADKHDAQLIIMPKSKQSFLKKIFGSSHTKNMASLSKVPLLILNSQ